MKVPILYEAHSRTGSETGRQGAGRYYYYCLVSTANRGEGREFRLF